MKNPPPDWCLFFAACWMDESKKWAHLPIHTRLCVYVSVPMLNNSWAMLCTPKQKLVTEIPLHTSSDSIYLILFARIQTHAQTPTETNLLNACWRGDRIYRYRELQTFASLIYSVQKFEDQYIFSTKICFGVASCCISWQSIIPSISDGMSWTQVDSRPDKSNSASSSFSFSSFSSFSWSFSSLLTFPTPSPRVQDLRLHIFTSNWFAPAYLPRPRQTTETPWIPCPPEISHVTLTICYWCLCREHLFVSWKCTILYGTLETTWNSMQRTTFMHFPDLSLNLSTGAHHGFQCVHTAPLRWCRSTAGTGDVAYVGVAGAGTVGCRCCGGWAKGWC